MLPALIAAAIAFASVYFMEVPPPAGSPQLLASASRSINGCPVDYDPTDAELANILGVTPEKIHKLHVMRGLTTTEICTIPPQKLARAMVKVEHPKTGFADDAARFREIQLAGDDGQVRPDGQVAALAARRAATVSGKRVAGITDSSWTPLGPGNIGGRLRSIVTHPTDDKLLLVGSVSGGIWKSVDGGAGWKPVNDFMPSVAISTMARDPSNSQRIYAGTGEGFANVHSIRGLGVFVSKDGGDNWSQLGGTVPGPAQPDFYYINRIAVHPTDSRIVLLATNGGIYRTENATDPTPTWIKVYRNRALDVKFDSSNGNYAVLGEGQFKTSAGVKEGGGVAYSDDAGKVFTRRELDAVASGRVEIAWAPATAGLVLAVSEGATFTTDGTVWASTDYGKTWKKNSTPYHLAGQGWYDNTIWVDPTDSRRVVIGGIDLYRAYGAADWWISQTALTWVRISAWQDSASVHADHHAIVPAGNYSTSNRVVYFGNDGGLHKTTDITLHDGKDYTKYWVNLNNGLQVTQFYSGAGKRYADGTVRIIGGTQDNGSLKAPSSGTLWTEFFGGDGGYSAIDGTDSNYYYGEYTYAAIHRANTGGNSAFICGGPNPIKESMPDEPGYAYCGPSATKETNFISPFVLDPNDANRLLVGAKSLWRSSDAKQAAQPSWYAIKAPDSRAENYISAIAVAPGDSKQIWVGHNFGEVYCTVNGTDATPTWTKVSTTLIGGTAPNRMVLRINVDPDNSNRVFVTYGGYESGNLRELTHDQQACRADPKVTSRQGNLPAAPVRSVVRHPKNRDWLYVGTEVGTFASTDGGVSWSTTSEGPGTVSVDELFWFDANTLVAATHGRSMFQATIPADARAPTVTTGAATVVAANSATVNGTASSNGASSAVRVHYGASTAYGKTRTATPSPIAADASDAKVSVTLDGLACGANYHYRVVGTNSIGTSNGVDATLTTTACGGGSAYSRAYVQKAYIAYYGRPADPAGQTYWAQRMDEQGRSLQAIVDAFANSDEFIRRYGSLSDEQLVTAIYRQTIARDPDPLGLAWYVAELRAGRITKQRIPLDVLNGASGNDATTVANKVDVAGYYTGRVAGGCPYGNEGDGVALLGQVSATAESVVAGMSAVDSRCGP